MLISMVMLRILMRQACSTQNFIGIKKFREHGTNFAVHKNSDYKSCQFSIVTNDFSPPSILIIDSPLADLLPGTHEPPNTKFREQDTWMRKQNQPDHHKCLYVRRLLVSFNLWTACRLCEESDKSHHSLWLILLWPYVN